MIIRNIERRLIMFALSLFMALTLLPAIGVRVYANEGDVIQESDYLTFTAEQNGSSVTMNIDQGSLWYRKGNDLWKKYYVGTAITLDYGESVRFRGNNVEFSYDNHVNITGKVACSGNIMSLRMDDEGKDQGLSIICFSFMFKDCAGLTSAPELPATTLAIHCYYQMFSGCVGLTTAPELPATTLAEECYYGMFSRCTGLTTAPELPATTLAELCYGQMFSGCVGLTTAPELPATTLADGCYHQMFSGCTGICISKTKTDECNCEYRVPPFGTGTTAQYALYDMFSNTGGTFKGTPEINKTYYMSGPASIISASVKYLTLGQGGKQTFTVNTSANARYLSIRSEDGTLVKRFQASDNSVLKNGVRTWTVSLNIASAGKRSLTILAGKTSTSEEASEKVSFTVVRKSIRSARAKESSIAKGAAQTFTVVTTGDVKYLSLYAEDGKTLVKTWEASGNSKIYESNFRSWTVSKEIASAGARKLIFKGGTTNATPVTNAVTVSFNVVNSGVISATAKYSAITKGSVQGFTVTTTADAKYLMLYAEDGKTLVKTWAASENSTVSGNVRTWNVMQTIGTAGSRNLIFKSGTTTTPSGASKNVSFKVETSGVLTATAKYSAITKGSVQGFTVTTTADANYLMLYAEDGKTLVKTWSASGNSTVSGNVRTWYVMQTIGTAGSRNLIFKAGSTSTPTAAMRASAFDVVDTGVISATAKYASINRGSQQTFTITTTANCNYLAEYAEEGNLVKTWTANSSNSTVSGNVRTWTVTQTISGAGKRTLMFKAGNNSAVTPGERRVSFTVK